MGNTHDSTAWEDTWIVQEHEDIIKDGEWIWADSAYPVCTCLCFYVPNSPTLTFYLKISAWVVAPYQKPKHDLPNNKVFNNHVSQVCIHSEHAMNMLLVISKANSNHSRSCAPKLQTTNHTSLQHTGLHVALDCTCLQWPLWRWWGRQRFR